MAAPTSNDLQKKVSNGKGPLTPKKISSSTFDVERIRVEDESEIEKKYQLGEVLGKGAFGVVKEVTHRDTKAKLAMKVVAKDKVSLSIEPCEVISV
jgi:serine/threonine protein kinase